MKKLLYSSVVLTLFSVSILVFQISCQKETNAEPSSLNSSGLTQLNKIIYMNGSDIYICNYDGTNNTKVNIVLPSGVFYAADNQNIRLSPDGKLIFFQAGPKVNGIPYGDLYSCKVDGSSVTKIIDRVASGTISFGGAY